jgi:hypothetical protein
MHHFFSYSSKDLFFTASSTMIIPALMASFRLA